ncbi:MAG: hypothetical protein V4474_00505 [Patescibacteria group bacterium]
MRTFWSRFGVVITLVVGGAIIMVLAAWLISNREEAANALIREETVKIDSPLQWGGAVAKIAKLTIAEQGKLTLRSDSYDIPVGEIISRAKTTGHLFVSPMPFGTKPCGVWFDKGICFRYVLYPGDGGPAYIAHDSVFMPQLPKHAVPSGVSFDNNKGAFVLAYGPDYQERNKAQRTVFVGTLLWWLSVALWALAAGLSLYYLGRSLSPDGPQPMPPSAPGAEVA